MISIQDIFITSNILTSLIWILMIVLPRWSWTTRIISRYLPVIFLALLYIALIAPHMREVFYILIKLDFFNLREFMASEIGGIIVWIHILAFDLFVGIWIFSDAQAKHLRGPTLGLILTITFLFGPAGYFLYRLNRDVINREKSKK